MQLLLEKGKGVQASNRKSASVMLTSARCIATENGHDAIFQLLDDARKRRSWGRGV